MGEIGDHWRDVRASQKAGPAVWERFWGFEESVEYEDEAETETEVDGGAALDDNNQQSHSHATDNAKSTTDTQLDISSDPTEEIYDEDSSSESDDPGYVSDESESWNCDDDEGGYDYNEDFADEDESEY